MPFHAVQIDDTFWSPRLETNRRTTIPFAFEQCEKTGRISNFDKAAGKLDGDYAGYFFNYSDVTRFVPSIGGFVYAYRERAIYIKLFVAGEATIPLEDNSVRIRQETRYPWSGHIKMTVHPRTAGEFEINIRIPGWASGVPLPGGLYSYLDDHPENATLILTGEPLAVNLHNGYARIKRVWQGGDVIELDLPMPVRRVIAHPKLKANAGRVALVRGPLVYCVEAADHNGRVHDLALPDEAPFALEARPDLLGGITVIRAAGAAVRRSSQEPPAGAASKPADLVAILYYAWNHRGIGQMTVWLPRVRSERDAPPRPRPHNGK